MQHFREIAAPVEGASAKPGKEFQGNGQNLLPLPGVKSVKAVFVSGLELPKEIDELVVKEGADNNATELVRVPLWQAVEIGGVLHLQRAEKSNHGIWQPGATITVIGEPAKTEPAKTEPAKTLDTDKK